MRKSSTSVRWCRSIRGRFWDPSPRPDGSSRSRKIRVSAAGAPRSLRLSLTRRSGISPVRSFASPRRTFRYPPPTTLKIWRCPAQRASSKRFVAFSMDSQMSATVIMPQLGETVAEGKILTWFKSVGDEIREGDNLFEVETDKVTIDVQAIVSGRLNEIRVGAGTVAKVGDIVAVVGGGGPSQEDARRVSPNAAGQALARTPFEEVSTPVVNF